MDKRKQTRSTNAQLKKLAEFMSHNPAFANSRATGPLGYRKIEALWKSLKEFLKGFGPDKSVDQWKQTWRDLKRKARYANAENPDTPDRLSSEMYKQIISTIGHKSSIGTGPKKSGIARRIPIKKPAVGVRPCTSSSSVKQENINIQPEVQATAIGLPDNIVNSEENPVTLDTSEFPEPVTGWVEVQTELVPEPRQTVSPTRNEPEWMKELETNSVPAENQMAESTRIIAEAIKKIAKASLMNAETNRLNAETNRMNAETNRMNAEISRRQLEFMKAKMDGQPGQPSSTCLRAKNPPQSENVMKMFCPKCNAGLSHTSVIKTQKEKERRKADKREEPPEKRCRARKRSREMDSSSEEDSLDDNEGVMEQSSNYHDEEPEIEVGPAAVNEEPRDNEITKEGAHSDPISIDVKIEPRDDEVNNTNEIIALNDEQTGTIHNGRKTFRRSDVISTRCSSVEIEVKAEEIDILDGYS